MIHIPLPDPVEYLTRRKFPYYRGIAKDHQRLLEAITPSSARGWIRQRPAGEFEGDGIPVDYREKGLKEIEAYQAELRAKPPEEIKTLYEEEQERERQEWSAEAEREERERFFNQPEAKADFAHWSKATYWTLDEAIALAFGKDPVVVNWQNVKSYVNPNVA